MAIWFHDISLDQLNSMNTNTINEHLGIEFIEIGDDYIKAKMPVDKRTHQPYGILHGGASVVLAESLGSMAASLCVNIETHIVMGLEVNANHLRPVHDGYVTGTATPAHLGRTVHVWEIKICDDHEKLNCISRLTVAVRERKT